MSEENARGVDSAGDDVPEAVAQLRQLVGSKLVAYMGSRSHTRFVSEWAEGLSKPTPDVAARLLVARDIAISLHTRDGKATIQSWFMGMNPDLNDDSPARLLREGTCKDIDNVKAAANNFFVFG